MRGAASEKLEIIRTVEESVLGITRTLRQLGIPKSTFYNWYDRYLAAGVEGLADRNPTATTSWNKVPEAQRQALLEMARDSPELSSRELAVKFIDDRLYVISEATVYRILKAHDLVTSPAWSVLKAADTFEQPTTAINQLWQTAFTYLKVTGWDWYYLSTVMDDNSRYILAWRLCQTMSAREVTATLKAALKVASLSKKQQPKFLSDNGPCYISAELQGWLADHGLRPIRDRPYHPMTQGKIERWHRSLKNRILLEHYFLPGELEREIGEFVTHYNTRRFHESLKNLTPEEVWLSKGPAILDRRRTIKEHPLRRRKQLYLERKTA